MLSDRRNKFLLPMLILLVFSIFGFSVFQAKPSQLALQSILDEAAFNQYLSKYSKSYSESEYLKRFQIFKQNLGYIRVFNSQGKSYYLSPTFFTDHSNSEFRSLYLSSAPFQTSSPAIETIENESDFPSSINWVDLGAVTPVKNQGSCGAGWAFATTGAVESAWFISKNSLGSLSEQQLIDCSPNYGCQAGWPSVAMQYIVTNGGITSESNYGYVGFQEMQCNLDAALIIDAKIRTYTNVISNNYQALANTVAQQPIAVSVDAGGPDWQNYGGGVLNDPNCGNNPNHAVLVVGYNFTGPAPFWICKNSWGTSWGEEGFIRIATVNGSGICGIQTSPTYPVV